MRSGERDLMRLAERQYAVLSSRQALDRGMTAKEVRTRLATGRWFTFFPGVFGLCGAPATFEQRAMAVCLAVGEPRAISQLTAARIWGLGLPEPDAVDVLTPPGRSVRLEGVRHHRTNVLERADLATAKGIPVTSVARTLHDCSTLVPPARLGWIVDEAERKKLVRLRSLRECNERLDVGGGRRPAVVMRELLAERAPGRDPGGSGWELWVRDALVGGGLPEPVQQHRVRVGRARFALDLAYPEPMICLEFDGWDTHSTFSAFHSDKRRRRLLVANGWRIVEVTSHTTAAEVVETTAQLLALTARPHAATN